MHDFSVWLRTSSNKVDINRFRSHTGKAYKLMMKKVLFLAVGGRTGGSSMSGVGPSGNMSPPGNMGGGGLLTSSTPKNYC